MVNLENVFSFLSRVMGSVVKKKPIIQIKEASLVSPGLPAAADQFTGNCGIDQYLCCVCLSRVEKEEGREGVARVLPCSHVFHRDCVDRWLGVCRRMTCPLCRFPMGGEVKKMEVLTEEWVIWFSSFHVAGF